MIYGGGYGGDQNGYDQHGQGRYDQRAQGGYDQHGQGGHHQRGEYDSRGGGDYSSTSSGYDEYSRGGGGGGYSGSRGYESGRGDYSSRGGGGYVDGFDGRSRGGGYNGSRGYDSGRGDCYSRGDGGYVDGFDGRSRGGGYNGSRGYDSDRGDCYSRGGGGYVDGFDDRSQYAGSSASQHDYTGGYDDVGHGAPSSGDREERGYGGGASSGGREERDYGGGDRGGYRRGDRGYGRRDDRGRGSRGGDRGYGGSCEGNRGDDRGYGGGRRGGRGGGRGGGRFGGGGRRGGRRGESGPGVGTVTGSGYENIGDPITDPRLREEWTGRAGVREVSAEDPDLQQEFLICRRPGFAKGGKSVQLQVNFFGVSLDGAPAEIFKYHVDVDRSPDLEVDSRYGPSSGPSGGAASDISAPRTRKQRPECPLPRTLVRRVINAAIVQYRSEFGDVKVVHDGMSAMYAPVALPWRSKTLVDVNPDDPSSTPAPPPQPPAAGEAPRRPVRRPHTFVVKMKLAESILTSSLTDYLSNPDVNVMPVLQALDVAARHLAAQRSVTVGRNFFSMKKTTALGGGKELCWGYHQAIRIADRKLVMNMDQATAVFYAPKELMAVVLAALGARSANDIRTLSERDGKALARALRKIEVVPTHRKDRKRAIFGVSGQPANQTMINIKGESMSVADYFSKRYSIHLKYPQLPPVNVGGKRAGEETWLPIEVCEVAPDQRCENSNDQETAEVQQTSKSPSERRKTIIDQVRQSGFENDTYLAAFGVKVNQRLETTDARVMDPPDVQYANVSERPSGGQWNLRDKRFVQGATVRNWGVVISANVGERDVQGFVRNLVDMAGRLGLTIEDSGPPMIHQNQFRGAQVEELMKTCFRELKARNKGPPQLIMVIKQDKSVESHADIKRTSDTVLGIPSQCIVSQHVRNVKPEYCANVCLKINMKLSGKNSILREDLPLVSSAPTIIIGADVEHPRSGMGSRKSIASVVASQDRFSAKYVARVAAQETSNDIQRLPHILRDLLLTYYKSTSRMPEHVIYYRDGVSEGQYYDILQAEMRALRKAFKMISDGYNPPVTFIIANKRHHMCAFPVDPRDGDRKGNVVVGTVIDTGIVDSHRFDFYLYGHSGSQGTSTPCHYTVLQNENEMSPEDVQRLTYHLGYTFARCTRSVSVVPPVYYAQLAAERARLLLNEDSDGASTVGSLNASSSIPELHEAVKDCMYFV